MKDTRGRVPARGRTVSDGPARARNRPAPTVPGKALDPSVRDLAETRFGHDFATVRVHTDGEAYGAARARGAAAYTFGEHICFAAGRYRPETDTGRSLIAHELAHVAQQARGGATPDAEARADRAANEVMRGGSVGAAQLGGAPIGIQAKPDAPGPASAPQEPDMITGADPKATDAAPAAAPSATVLDDFTRNKATLKKKHRAAIDQIAFQIWLHLSLYADAKASIAITGHTDTTGAEKHNEGLSTERAGNAREALEAALKKQDVDVAKLGITATSRGETALRVATGDEVDEPGNRRVEIEVTIEVKAPPKPAPPPTKLPGTPGGPKIWEVPGILDEFDPPAQPIPRVPASKDEWLKGALERDPLLRKLPEWARKKAIDALKDADEKAADAIIDALPFDGEYKEAAKAAMKALLQTLKGRKFKPPPDPPKIPDWDKAPGFPKMPGEMIFKLPPIRF